MIVDRYRNYQILNDCQPTVFFKYSLQIEVNLYCQQNRLNTFILRKTLSTNLHDKVDLCMGCVHYIRDCKKNRRGVHYCSSYFSCMKSKNTLRRNVIEQRSLDNFRQSSNASTKKID